MVIAVPTRQAEVIKRISTLGIDMINLHSLSAIGLGSLAVFATTACAIMDLFPNVGPGLFTHDVA